MIQSIEIPHKPERVLVLMIVVIYGGLLRRSIRMLSGGSGSMLFLRATSKSTAQFPGPAEQYSLSLSPNSIVARV